jgi:hypothetical protein
VVISGTKSIFQPGMAYTAVSRVRHLHDIIFQDFEERKFLMASNSVIMEYFRLETLPTPNQDNNWASNILDSLPIPSLNPDNNNIVNPNSTGNFTENNSSEDETDQDNITIEDLSEPTPTTPEDQDEDEDEDDYDHDSLLDD